jgi:hypothetical protein
MIIADVRLILRNRKLRAAALLRLLSASGAYFSSMFESLMP